MCHGKAQNVPREGTKCATVWHKKTYVLREGTKCAAQKDFKDLCATRRHKMCRSTAQNDF
jgi:hypothetical protein